jgi:hypothetical protein
MDQREAKDNLEINVWQFSSTFKLCRDRAFKQANYSVQGSGQVSEEELKLFSNCVTKNFKAISLFPAIIQ